MKKRYYILLFFYISLLMALLVYHLLGLFDINLQSLWGQWDRLGRFGLFLLILSLAVSVFLVFVVRLAQSLQLRRIQKNLSQILQGQEIENPLPDLEKNLTQLAAQLENLTKNLQATENQVLEEREKTVEGERRRIARDLHDTVSQELFAATMILSSLAGQLERLSLEQTQSQLEGVRAILDTAQKDLRILLLHLRPTELEGRSLVEGLSVILAEVRDKSDVRVTFEHEVTSLPQIVEEHIFRIAQEIISNTLRHAQARHLEVYLYQRSHQVQLRMVDDGVGFERSQASDVSYGLANIEERVKDMAGTLKILSAPQKGVTIDIRVPLVERKKDEDFTSR